jgi:hypothetical protein
VLIVMSLSEMLKFQPAATSLIIGQRRPYHSTRQPPAFSRSSKTTTLPACQTSAAQFRPRTTWMMIFHRHIQRR